MSPLCFAPSLAVGAVRPDLKHALSSPTSKVFLTKKVTRCSTPTMAWSRNIVEPKFPDWENHGADLTFANVSEEGDIDMIALSVDAPKEQNQGYYRLIKGVTRNGDGDYSIGEWGERIPVPGWFSWRNQGAGVAVMKNGNMKDIVVMMIDNPQESNAAYYKIGYDLDHNGYVTKGWTDFIKIPGDFGWENQGAGIDVANISGEKNNRDLVVFYIDNPKEMNVGYYRIGFNLDDQGHAKSWSDRFEVPNWFSWENQGGGVVVHDTNQNGKLDIVIFFIDNPLEKNMGYYTIGRNLDSGGKVTGGWTEMRQIPDWFSWENQGGGIAVGKFPKASPTLSTYFIDNPSGKNYGILKFGDDAF